MKRRYATPYARDQPGAPPKASNTTNYSHVPQYGYQPPGRQYTPHQNTSYQPYTPLASQPLPIPVYTPQKPTQPSYSTQVLRTMAPDRIEFTSDAAMVPIRSLQPEKAFVRVSGRTVRAPDVKAFLDRKDPGKQRWLQSFTIKDDVDTIDVKYWHKTQEHLNACSNISLDQVVHVWTDEVKLNSKPVFGNQATSTPTTTSPFFLSLNEGRVGHKIELGNEADMATLFRVALGANIGGVVPSVSIKQVMGVLSTVGQQRFNLAVCVKKLISSGVIKTKNGPMCKTEIMVFDAQGQAASMTTWGEPMGEVAQQWTPFVTMLLLTGAQVSMYAMKPQITVGYQTHIQVNPICKNIEWLKHFAAQCTRLPDALNSVVEQETIPIDHIQTSYRIADMMRLINAMGGTDIAYGFSFVILTELDIDTRAAEVLTAKCPSCKEAILSFKKEACSKCNAIPTNDDAWRFALAQHISFMDDTAELRHPGISSEVVQKWLGYNPADFSALPMAERIQLKKRFFMERLKIYFKVSWSDHKKQQTMSIIAIEQVHLPDLECINQTAKI
ncbi:hypothetical protein BG011_004322 [Mortierella polycephala]|uniref:MEIOB-like N-terminal domain-containing protein n=1 Tax=Mortierella polycephala TaxID=41804 RepID=A0A9P6U2H0_9FUNG|nr:hypothetical protein BG011_004322 [Mortierella polycephala]